VAKEGLGGRVCFFQAYYTDYIRAQTLKRGLKANGVDLAYAVANMASIFRYPLGIVRYLGAVRSSDIVLANFRSFEILWLLRLLTRKPIVYDAYISVWASVVEERHWFGEDSIPSRILRIWERANLRMADHILMDTKAHAGLIGQMHGIKEDKISHVYISCEDDLFFPQQKAQCSDGINVFWCGSGIPLQGFSVIYDAFTGPLSDRADISLTVAGSSDIIDGYERKADREGIKSIRFLGRIERDEVIKNIAKADICLGGHYSDEGKAAYVIAGKAFEMMAMGKPVILGDSPAVRELFTDREHALLCKREDAKALASAIAELADDAALSQAIAGGARRIYEESLMPERNVKPLIDVIGKLLDR